MSGLRAVVVGMAWACLLACLGAVALPPDAGAAPPEPPRAGDASSIPPFRRIYIPEKEIENRPWDGAYLPIERAEFERLLETLETGSAGAPGARSAHVERGDYVAQLVGDDLLMGSSTLRLARRTPTVPSLLNLDPCSLAISKATWHDQQGHAAVLGNSPQGRLQLLVEGELLNCEWSLRGERTAAGAMSFRLALPPCPLARLVLDAPAGLEISSDQGIISKAPGPAPQTTRWTLELGGFNQVNLRVVPEGTARERRPLTLLRQSMMYQFSTRGIRVDAQLKLDVHGEPLQRIAVDLDPSLRLVTARYGELEVPWSATSDVESQMTHVVLQMPEPVAGTGRVLQLTAMAPMTSGKMWRLPGLKPEGVSWQEGVATLLIPNSFALEQLVTLGCRQSRITALPSPLTGESIEIQYYRAGASIEVLLAQPRERMKVDSGTLIEVGANEITSRMQIQLSLAHGERGNAQFDVQPGWTIDAVENVGGKSPLDWEFDESAEARAVLKLRFERAITPTAGAKVLVRGHRALPAGPVFEAEQFAMFSFGGFQHATRLIGVRAADGTEIRWTGSEDLKGREAAELSPAEQQLFPQPPTGLLFADDDVFGQSSVSLQRRKPRYTAEIRADAAVHKGTLTETYAIQCVPDAARVERLLIHFSQARPTPLDWSVAGGNSGQFSARKLSPAEQAQIALPAGGEVWELNVHLARAGAFELRAVRSVEFAVDTPLSLAAVTDASTQKGTLTVRALGDTGLSINNRRLTSIPAELLEANRYQTVRAAFRYQPSRDDLGAEAAVSISPAPSTQAESGAWAWSGKLESRFSRDGVSSHWATFHLQTAGRQELVLKLPQGAALQEAWLNQRRLPLSEEASQEGGWPIVLPSGHGFATLTVYFSTPEPLPSLFREVHPPFPSLDGIEVLARDWSVWLPPGYAVETTDSRYVVGATDPTSWRERLFGPLGRSLRGTVFNPLLAPHWRRAWSDADTAAAHQNGQSLIEAIGTVLAQYDEAEELTWGQLLGLIDEAGSRVSRALRVDMLALNAAEFDPQTRITTTGHGTPLERGREVLAGNRLALLISPTTLVLTSTAGAESLANYTHPDTETICHLLVDDSLLAAVDGPEPAAGSRFISIEAWRTRPQEAMIPWEQVATREDPGPRGWQHYVVDVANGAPQTIRIVYAPTLRSLAWSLFLAVAGFGLWKFKRQSRWLVLLVAVTAAAGLCLPPRFGLFANAALLGGLLCLLFGMIRLAPWPRASQPPGRKTPAPRSDLVHTAGMVLWIVALLHAGGIATAQEKPMSAAAPPVVDKAPPAKPIAPAAPTPAAPASAATAATPVARVFVPVDDQQMPLGTYYIPEELFRHLYRQSAAVSGQPEGFVVTRAVYQGSLARDTVNKRFELSQLKASYDLVVLQENATVRLPLPKEGIEQPILAARLEGRPVPVLWNATGDALILGPLAADKYHLELDLEPPLQSNQALSGIDMAIPPLANATLELTLPADSPTIEVPSARGSVTLQKDRGLLYAQLGATNRLSVRWPPGAGTEAAVANMEVDELIWVKVRPGTTVLEAHFKFRVLAGRVRQIRLLTDPRLRLLPSAATASPVSAVHTIPGDPQRIDLELANEVSDQVAINLSFLVTGNSGVGYLRLPRLESAGARAAKRWLAVSVDPALQANVQAGDDSPAMETANFVEAWGGGETRPQSAFVVPRGEPLWGLATEPNEPQVEVEQTSATSFGRGVSSLQFDAKLSISGGFLFQLRLAVPQDLEIEQISLLEDGAQRVARWATDERGQVSIFLTAPVHGRQQLALTGRWTAPLGVAMPVPKLAVLGAQTKRNLLILYRQPTVLAEVEAGPDYSEAAAEDVGSREGLDAFLGAYQSEGAPAPLMVKLTPNVPNSRAVAATFLQRDGDRWIADFEYHLEVVEGLIDVLQFEIPPQWTEPFRVEPATQFKVVPVPGEQRRQLLVYPEKPIAGKYELKVRGRTTPFSAGVPDIVPLRAQQVERYVVLPQYLDLQQVAWDTFGLSRGTLPSQFAGRAAQSESFIAYQVAGEHFQASLKTVQRASAAAQVKLADIHLRWQPGGESQGVANFDVEPGGAGSCVLELPAGARLLHVSVESLPALLTPLEPGRWRMRLGPQQLPQRVEVVYVAPSAGNRYEARFLAPRLIGLQVAQTLWTLYGPRQAGWGEPRQAEWRVEAAMQQLERVKNVAALVQLPTETAGEHLPDEIARWYLPWKNRYVAARATFDWELDNERPKNSDSEEGLAARALDKQIAVVDARVGVTKATSEEFAPAGVDLFAAENAELFPARYAIPGEAHEIELRYPQAASLSSGSHLLIGLAILLLGGCLAYLLGTRPLPKFAPWIVLAIVGLAWWLMLVPSAMGLAMLVVAAAWGLVDNWREDRKPATR